MITPTVSIVDSGTNISSPLNNIIIFEYDNYGLSYNNKYLTTDVNTLSFIDSTYKRNIVICPGNEIGVLSKDENLLCILLGNEKIYLRTYGGRC